MKCLLIHSIKDLTSSCVSDTGSKRKFRTKFKLRHTVGFSLSYGYF